MQRLKALIWKAIFLLFMALSLNAQAKALAVPEAVVSFANREIAVLRASVQGATPEVRVRRIEERLRLLEEKDLAKPLQRSPTEVEHQNGVLFSIGDRAIFILFEADLDEEAKLSLDAAADLVEVRFKAAIAATLEQRSGPVLLLSLIHI